MDNIAILIFIVGQLIFNITMTYIWWKLKRGPQGPMGPPGAKGDTGFIGRDGECKCEQDG